MSMFDEPFPFPKGDPSGTSRIMAGIAPNGEPIVSVVFGMNFAVARDGRCSALGYEFVDEAYYMKAHTSSRHTRPSLLVRDTDGYAWRNFTDIVVQGFARSDKPVKSLNVELDIKGPATNLELSIAVTGDRWVDRGTAGPVASEPQTFVEMPMLYERAYGGTDEEAEEKYEHPDRLNFMASHLPPEENEEISRYSYPRNPAGRGYLVDEVGLYGTALPNLEFPNERVRAAELILPLSEWGVRPYPACFDWFHPGWFPRIAYALDTVRITEQTVPEPEKRMRLFNFAKYNSPQRDIHPFANGAHPFLSRNRLVGNEAIRVTHMAPDGRDFGVILPKLSPEVSIKLVGDARVRIPASIDLVLLEAEAERLTMLFRATHFTKREHLPAHWIEQSEYEIHW